MGRNELKTRTQISNTIDNELLKQLKEYSQETSIPMSKLLDKAIELLLKTTKK